MKKLRVTRILLTVLLVASPLEVNALGYIFPSVNTTQSSGNPPTSSVNETVALSSYTTPSSGVWGIDTGITEYKVFVRSGHASDNITIEYACEGRPHAGTDQGGRDYEFANGVSQTRWRLYRTNSSENPTTNIGTINSYDAICNGGNVTQSFTASGSAVSSVPGHNSYRVYIIRVEEINQSGPDGAGKGFKIRSQWASTHVTPRELFNPSNMSEVSGRVYPASKAYALLDGIRDTSRPDTTYRFRFSPDCRYPNNAAAYIKWFDADININQDSGMRLRIRKNGSYIPLQAYRTRLGPPPSSTSTPIGNNDTIIQGAELMGGTTSSGAYGLARFTAERDAIYDVEWTGVNNTNALQFWLPFSEINATTNCPDVDYNVTGSCDAIRGYFVYPERPQEKYPIRIQFRLEGDSWGSPITVQADDATPDPPGSNFSNGFNLNVPQQYLSSTRRTQFRAYNNTYRSGSTIYLSTGRYLGVCLSEFNLEATATPPSITAEPGTSFTLSRNNLAICNSGPVAPANRGPAHDIDIVVNLDDFGGADGATRSYNDQDIGGTTSSCWRRSTNYSLNIPNTAQVGDELCAVITARPKEGFTNGTRRIGSGTGTARADFCITVVDGPYLQVYGNDVWSGGRFDTTVDGSGDCLLPPSGSTANFGQVVSHVRSNVGAMSEYAAYAWGVVEQFGTASAPSGNSLTFANVNVPNDGNFGEQRCLKKIFDGGGAGGTINNALWDSDATQDITQGSSTNLNNITNGQNGAGQFSVSGDAHLSNPWPNMRNSKTFLINGNLNLTSNISSFSNGWQEGQVPVVVFIVTGDIYIGPGVSRLDGIFVANGTISTCAPQGSESAFNQFLAVGQACDTHLEINGQLIANNIAFRRVKGGTNEAATGTGANSRCVNGGFYDNLNRRCAAETIRFPAAFYLADIVLDYGSTGDPNNYPIQQIRDLPPIY